MKKHLCFFQTAETGNRTPDSSVKGSSANHYPRAPALVGLRENLIIGLVARTIQSPVPLQHCILIYNSTANANCVCTELIIK